MFCIHRVYAKVQWKLGGSRYYNTERLFIIYRMIPLYKYDVNIENDSV